LCNITKSNNKKTGQTFRLPCLPVMVLHIAGALAGNKGFTVGTLDHCGVLLMCTHSDLVKGAVIALAGVICALSHSTFDLIVLTVLVHFHFLSPSDV